MDRVFFMMRVRDGHQDEYMRRHREVWPEVLAEHTRAGVTKMAIYMKGTDVCLYMEAEDYAKAVRVLSKSPEVLRWEEYMAPIMESTGSHGFDPANAYPASLPEAFFWESADHGNEVRKPRAESADPLPPSAPHITFPRQSPVKS